MGKKVLIGVGVVVLVLAIIIWQVVANLDSLVAGMVEDIGSDVLKTEVRVSGMSVDLQGGKVDIGGLTIANPEGYTAPNVFEMKGISVDLALNSIGKDVLVIEAILIDSPKIFYEGDAGGGSNMQTLLDNMDSGSSADEAAGGEPIKIIINRFELKGARVLASSEIKPGEAVNVKLPAIGMTSIGRAEGGVTPDVAVKEITNELLNEIITAAAKAGINKIIEEKKRGFLNNLKDLVEDPKPRG